MQVLTQNQLFYVLKVMFYFSHSLKVFFYGFFDLLA